MDIVQGSNVKNELAQSIIAKYILASNYIYRIREVSTFESNGEKFSINFCSLSEDEVIVYIHFVKNEGGEIIGLLMSSSDGNYFSSTITADIVWVKEEYRGNGIAKKMYRELIDYLPENHDLHSSFSLGTDSLRVWYSFLKNEENVNLKHWNPKSGKAEFVKKDKIAINESGMISIDGSPIVEIEGLMNFEWNKSKVTN